MIAYDWWEIVWDEWQFAAPVWLEVGPLVHAEHWESSGGPDGVYLAGWAAGANLQSLSGLDDGGTDHQGLPRTNIKEDEEMKKEN